MADVKNFSLAGVGTKLQLGKGGAKLVQTGDAFAFRNNSEASLTTVEVAIPTTTFHATNKQYVDGKLAALSSSRISDNKTAPTAMVATDAVTGKVTIDAKGTTDLATRVATFESGVAADTSATIGNTVAGEVIIKATSANASANLHLQAQGPTGAVIVGEAGTNALMIADDNASMTLAGGDSATGVGGDLIMRGGDGLTGSGNVLVATGTGTTHTRFTTNANATAYTEIAVGQTEVTYSVAGSEPNVSIVFAPKGTGGLSVSGNKVSNVAAGIVGTDAVNLAQLQAVSVDNKVGSLQTREITISTASMDIGLPIRGHIRRVMLKITTGYSAGTQLTVGRAGFLDELVDSNSIDETTVGLYDLNISHKYSVEVQLRATITGGPAAGAATLVVEYIQG